MAERRMFAKTIIDSDAFLDMSASAQNLYFHLGMRADDDGFVNSPKKIMRTVGASPDDLNILCAKKFILPFDDGVVVIKHWRIHNYIRKDTYNETPYKEDKALLELDENNGYRLRPVDGPWTQVRLGKVSIGKSNNTLVQIPTQTESISEEFEAIWTLYPRHEGKQNAFKAYQKARKEGISRETIENGVRIYLKHIRDSRTEAKYIKMGSTWFNQRCWSDEYKDAPASGHPINPNANRDDTFGEIPF